MNIVITGASSGIGEGTSRLLVSKGHTVYMLARRADRLKSIQKDLENESGTAHVKICDVTSVEGVKSTIDEILTECGAIDVVVNNAGIMPLSYLKNGKLEEAHRMVDVNIKGVLNVIYAVLPSMIERNKGHFVNVSSVAAKMVFLAGSVYCATKHAVRALSEGLHMEMAREGYKVRVTDIQPGAVATELSNTITDEDAKGDTAKWEKVDFLQADDIARAVDYAISQPEAVSVNELTIRPWNQPS